MLSTFSPLHFTSWRVFCFLLCHVRLGCLICHKKCSFFVTVIGPFSSFFYTAVDIRDRSFLRSRLNPVNAILKPDTHVMSHFDNMTHCDCILAVAFMVAFNELRICYVQLSFLLPFSSHHSVQLRTTHSL